MKLQFADFRSLKKTHDRVDSSAAPTGHLITQPFARARTRHDAKTPGSDLTNPIDLWRHTFAL